MRAMRFARILFFGMLLCLISASAFAGVVISINIAPPVMPVYVQPPCPQPSYIWTPGYWAWGPQGYYWVPGAWVPAPYPGALWTPGYWGWSGGLYIWHAGYWGPHVGFYGGINYGFGYFGFGFVGGRWDGGHFFYNRDVMNVNVVNIHNVYNEHINITNVSHVSYNGGEGGINARPRPEDEIADHDRRIGPVAAQNEHIQAARGNRDLRASVNQGRPSIAASARPGDFHGSVVAAHEAGAPYHAPENRGGAAPRAAVHPNDLAPIERPAAPNTGDANRDRKYQQQQQKLMDKQNQERQKLQAQQEREHQQLASRNASEAERQQTEQRHAQQTQQLQQKHATQMQNLQSHISGGRRK